MAVASLLTFLAVAGVIAGVLLGESQEVSCYLAAAGGGLLFGISLFWLVPEIAAVSGWFPASALTLAACLALALIDRLFIHSNHGPGRVALAPILTATAVHSFLDGWSVRAIESLQMASITAPLGLALHKIPEGVAIGWIARQSIGSVDKAAAAAIAVELVTLVGAFVEPYASRSGSAAFGAWWTSAVIAIVSGSFLFFGVHAILPNRRRAGVLLVFVATLLLVATIGLVKSGSIYSDFIPTGLSGQPVSTRSGAEHFGKTPGKLGLDQFCGGPLGYHPNTFGPRYVRNVIGLRNRHRHESSRQ